MPLSKVPLEPMLLDTCVVQNLEWVLKQQLETTPWTQAHETRLRTRYGPLADELLALWKLVEMYERDSNFPPWIVSGRSLAELGGHPGPNSILFGSAATYPCSRPKRPTFFVRAGFLEN